MNILPLPDPRPYPETPVKNTLLLYASQLTQPASKAQTALARENLHGEITRTLMQGQLLNLSVAMNMAQDAAQYTVLMDAVDEVLSAQNSGEIQWFALPVVLVSGSHRTHTLNTETPSVLLSATLGNYPALRPLSQAQWLPALLRAEDFAAIKADAWFAAKQNEAAAAQFAASLPDCALELPEGQSVHVLYAVGYGNARLRAALGQNLRDAALPLMQVWQQHLTQPDLTLFANPLNPNSPIAALADAQNMRLKMALDVFATNAIRSIRMQSPRVGVVMAAQEGGKLLFGFGAAETSYALQNQIFTWQLSPRDNIRLIQQHFLDLLTDCRIEYLRQLEEMLPENAPLPDYEQSLQLSGSNPLLS